MGMVENIAPTLSKKSAFAKRYRRYFSDRYFVRSFFVSCSHTTFFAEPFRNLRQFLSPHIFSDLFKKKVFSLTLGISALSHKIFFPCKSKKISEISPPTARCPPKHTSRGLCCTFTSLYVQVGWFSS